MPTTTLPSPSMPRNTRLLGVGSYRPTRVVDNAQIAANTGLTEDWILARSGIHTRRWADSAETLPVMGAAAAEKALAMAGVVPSQIDCVIAASITHLVQTPALAVDIAHRIGSDRAAAFDVGAACAGFCHAIALASDMIRLHQAEHVLVIGAERMSDILNHHDQSTAFLFADGAGAVVVGPATAPGIGPVTWRADGSRMTALGMSAHWERSLVEGGQGSPDSWPSIQMVGWKVFRWATTELAPAVQQILDSTGLTIEEIDVFIPHQANMLITDHLVGALGFKESTVVARDIVRSGNTSAASIPLALDALLESGAARSGDTALLLGFGAGLVYAGQVVHLP